MYEPWVTLTLSISMGVCAAYRGGEPERLAALLLITSIVAYSASRILFGDPGYYTVYPGGMIIDFWLLVALVWVALRANRGWPLVVGALQIVIMLGHISKLVDSYAARKAYWAMTHLPFVVQMAVVIAGCWAHDRRRRRIGQYLPWRPA
ncbi:hypothetical protein RXV95_05915 [Novosphingobium sp. ZN18A2]|uniref:hypothetical protein n=1 Tax=Novosphingobium sp. ZN18A2 TaxID=3079861 RepID=UPI0030CDCED2